MKPSIAGYSERDSSLDKKKGTFISYRHEPRNSNSLSNDFVLDIYEDSKANLWAGTFRGLNRMDRKTSKFTSFLFYPEDTNSFGAKPRGQGTGPGLSLSYDIVKAHGGEIKVETTEGEGAEFIILPPG